MSAETRGNLTWHEGTVRTRDREAVLGQRGCVVWLTGLSGSGKSTVARAVEQRLVEAGHAAYVLDGDNVRHALNADLGFTPADRAENIRRIGEVAALFADAGLITIVAFISPYRRDRDRVRTRVAPGRFIEVHLDAPLHVCEARDPKGLYRRARNGEIPEFTGVSAPYEPPQNPELRLNSGELSAVQAAERVLAGLRERHLLEPPRPHTERGPGP